MIYSVFRCIFLGYGYESGGRFILLCGFVVVLVVVYVKIEVFFCYFVVGVVFMYFVQCFIKCGFQFGVVFMQVDIGVVVKVFFVFNGWVGEGEIFFGRLFQEVFVGGDFILQCCIQMVSCEV